MKRGPQSGFSGFSGFAMSDKKRGRFEDTEERKRPPPAALLGFDDGEEEGEEAGSDRHRDASKEEPNEEKQNVEAADAEDEVDPLDAFMEGIHDTVKKEKAGIIKPAQTKVRVVDFGSSSSCCRDLGTTLYYDASILVQANSRRSRPCGGAGAGGRVRGGGSAGELHEAHEGEGEGGTRGQRR